MDLTDSKATQVFKYLDKTNQGHIDKENIIQAMRYLGIIKTQTAFEALINELPNTLTLDHFLNLINIERDNLIDKQNIIKAFEVFDEKKTGKVNAKELYHALSVIGEKLTKNDIDALTKMAQPDKDGRINYLDLVDCLLSQN